MSEQNLTWKEIETEHLIQDEWLDFRKSTYRMPDGSVWSPFYTYSRKDYVVIVATDEEGRYICVRQFRQGLREVTTEFPAGGVEPSEGSDHTLETAIRELREETGYESDDWTFLMKIPANATISDNYAYLYQAKGCRPVTDQSLDATEFVEITTLTPGELEALIAQGGFQQAMHLLALKLAKN